MTTSRPGRIAGFVGVIEGMRLGVHRGAGDDINGSPGAWAWVDSLRASRDRLDRALGMAYARIMGGDEARWKS